MDIPPGQKKARLNPTAKPHPVRMAFSRYAYYLAFTRSTNGKGVVSLPCVLLLAAQLPDFLDSQTGGVNDLFDRQALLK